MNTRRIAKISQNLRLLAPLPLVVCSLLAAAGPAAGQQLFVGIETASPPPTRTSDLAGFPDVTWQNRFAIEVSGAAATPDGLLYLCNGPFTTQLYSATLDGGPPQPLSTAAVDLTALAYGRDTLWGYSNYATPKGIYAVDPATGGATLVLDVYTGTGFRFFALDYNPVDDLLYGYTEYGASGLYSIDIDSGEMLQLAGTIPAVNGQGRGMAVGNNTVYLTATRGDDDIPFYAYDLAQGPGGVWVPFTNAYPDYHSTGGAAWIPGPASGILDRDRDPGALGGMQLAPVAPSPAAGAVRLDFRLAEAGDVRLTVHDVRGRRVATVIAGLLGAGRHVVGWEARDAGGRPLPAGIYFARLEAAGRAPVATRKIVLIR